MKRLFVLVGVLCLGFEGDVSAWDRGLGGGKAG
jgi:hypothetical protein